MSGVGICSICGWVKFVKVYDSLSLCTTCKKYGIKIQLENGKPELSVKKL